jgi:hypothetical protein
MASKWDHIHAKIVLADGSQTSTLGCFGAKLQMDKHSNKMCFHVTKLVDGFDIMLGNDWSLQQQVEAKFGGASPTDSHLYLSKTQTRVYPLNNSGRSLPRAHEAEQALLPDVSSAVQVGRLLKQGPKRGRLEPFLVMVRQKPNLMEEGTHPQTLRSDRLKALLDKYSTVFQDPKFGASANTVSPCIELEPGSTPPNRPASRLPMSQRQEVERRVAELVEIGGIPPSSSASGTIRAQARWYITDVHRLSSAQQGHTAKQVPAAPHR